MVVKDHSVRKRIKFAFLPTRRTSYTLVKAPMAHKTNSKEQLMFRIFYFTTSIKADFKFNNQPTSLHSALLILFLTRSLFPIFETNLLLLKSYVFALKMSDASYFNYYRLVQSFNKRQWFVLFSSGFLEKTSINYFNTFSSI